MTTAVKAALAVLAIAGLVAAKDAWARTQMPLCAPRSSVIEQLAKSFDERPVSYGITAEGALVEILVAPGGSWTILLTAPGGNACLMAHGIDWEPRHPQGTGPVT